MSAKAGVDLAAWGQGVCAGDADGDGRIDLYVTNWGANVLFRNKGDGTFEDIAAQAGVAAGGWSTGCAFFDADADGDLDLYVARYVRTTWEDVVAREADADLAQRAEDHGRSAGPAGRAGPVLREPRQRTLPRRDRRGRAHRRRGAYGFGVVATDYDGDGRVDLFVANDSNPNFLYRNVTPPGGAPRFESVGLIAGVAVNGEARAQAGMGADAGDYDGDGRIDLALTAFAHDRNTIYRNVDGGGFEDASGDGRHLPTSTFARMGWGTAFLDADLDGRLDLVVANGHIFPDVDRFPALGETYAQASQLLLNQGGTFRDVSAGTGRRPADAARQPRPRRRRPRRRRRSRRRPQQHGRAAGAAREPPADRPPLDRVPLERAGGQPPRDRRDRDDHERRQDADARGALRRQLPVAVRSAAAVRARRRGGAGVGRGPDARRRPLVVAGSAGGPPAHARADRDRPPMTDARLRLVAVAGLLSLSVGVAAQTPSGAVYRPALKPPEFLEPFAPKLDAGHDAFTDEPIAAAIEAQLRAFGEACQKGPCAAAVNALLATDARGEPLFHPIGEAGARSRSSASRWSRGPSNAPRLVARPRRELRRLQARHDASSPSSRSPAIDGPDAAGVVPVDVRFDLVGQRRSGGAHPDKSASWRQRWRKDPAGWRIVEWKTIDMAMSRAVRPIFTEITRGRPRRHRGVPPAAEHAARRVDRDRSTPC